MQKMERAQIASAVLRVPGAQTNPVLVQLETHDDGSGIKLHESLALTAKPGDSEVGAVVRTDNGETPVRGIFYAFFKSYRAAWQSTLCVLCHMHCREADGSQDDLANYEG